MALAIDAAHLTVVIKAVAKHARTSHIGDGKIFVSEISKVVRIRTGETDRDAQ